MIRQFGVHHSAWLILTISDQTSPTQNCPWLPQSQSSVPRTPDSFLITLCSFSPKCLSQRVTQYLPVCVLIWCRSSCTTGYTRAESSPVLITALYPATRTEEAFSLCCWIHEWTLLLSKTEFPSKSFPSSCQAAQYDLSMAIVSKRTLPPLFNVLRKPLI